MLMHLKLVFESISGYFVRVYRSINDRAVVFEIINSLPIISNEAEDEHK